MPLTFDGALKAFSALASATFAVLVLAGAPRRAPNRWLALFLFLVAGNQLAEAARSLLGVARGTSDALFVLAVVCSALDPAALYAFAAAFPEDEPLVPRRSVPVAWGVGVALALIVPWASPVAVYYVEPLGQFLLGDLLQFSLSLFTTVIYLVVLVRAASRVLTRSLGGSPWSQLLPALAIAAVPRGLSLAKDVVRLTANFPNWPLPIWWGDAVIWPLMAIAIVPIALFIRHQDPRVRRVFQSAILAAFGIVLLLDVEQFPRYLGFRGGGVGITSGSAALRWLSFGLLVSIATLRHDMLRLSFGARRKAARALITLATLSVALVTLQLAQGLGAPLRTVDWGILIVVLLATQAFRRFVDAAAHLVYGVPIAGDVVGRQEAYRDAVARAVAQGSDPPTDESLRRLREDLAIDAATATALERLARATAAGPLVPGRTLHGRYRILRLVGRGSGGRAFLARDTDLDRDVVLKEILLASPEDEETALREARTLARVRHRGILTLYDVVRAQGAVYLVTEHAPRGSLADRVLVDGPLSAHEGCEMLDQLLDALEAVHAEGLVHRDIKPENVLLDADGAPLLADFGIAGALGGGTVSATQGRDLAGTLIFMAPEQLRGERATPASDVYALGMLARRCVATPLPASLAAVIARAVRDAPVERWVSAGEMRAALRITRSSQASR